MIPATPKSAAYLRSIAPSPAHFFRVAVRAGGCMGLSQLFEFCQEPNPGEVQWESEGIKFISDSKSIKLLQGSTLDYETSLMKNQLILKQPEQTRHCSCGESFSR